MKKCYILGATAKGKEIFLIYKNALANKLEILGTPIETSNFKGTSKERFQRAKDKVKQSEIIIADMSEVSTGAGIELGISYLLGKKIFVFASVGSEISSLIYGITENVKFYHDEKELFEMLTIVDF